LKVSIGSTDREGIKERIASRLERIEASYGRRILRGTGVLATIGATAPFVGLFGTVWGIMNSFIGISKSHTTNLAVVAPGIAEALLDVTFRRESAAAQSFAGGIAYSTLACRNHDLGKTGRSAQWRNCSSTTRARL
jgi:biopolymer transport protein ExbB